MSVQLRFIGSGDAFGSGGRLNTCFHVTGEQVKDEGPGLGKLEVFSGVGQYPVRVKCATLAWHTLDAALEGRGETVSTEDTSAKSFSGGD